MYSWRAPEKEQIIVLYIPNRKCKMEILFANVEIYFPREKILKWFLLFNLKLLFFRIIENFFWWCSIPQWENWKFMSGIHRWPNEPLNSINKPLLLNLNILYNTQYMQSNNKSNFYFYYINFLYPIPSNGKKFSKKKNFL